MDENHPARELVCSKILPTFFLSLLIKLLTKLSENARWVFRLIILIFYDL